MERKILNFVEGSTPEIDFDVTVVGMSLPFGYSRRTVGTGVWILFLSEYIHTDPYL